MKKIILTFLCLWLWGCNQKTEIKKSPQIPPHVTLKNADQAIVGYGLPVKDNIFITADHIFQEWKELFYYDEQIEIIARSFEHDLLVFSAEHDFPLLKKGVELSDVPPNLEKEILWLDGKRSQKSKILSLSADFLVNGEKKKNLLVLDGTIQQGKSGTGIFDKKGKIYGLLIGSDPNNNQSFAIRSDVILEFLTKNIDE